MVERDAALCEELANDYRDCTVICDNGTRQETLLEAGIDRADAFLALSGVDEENAIISMYAKTREVGKIITMISRISYVDFFKSAGLESIVSPRSSTASYILRYVRSFANSADSSAIESLHKIMNDRIEALELSVKDDIPELTDLPLKRIRPRAGVLIACIVRGGDVIIPGGDDCIKKGDSVIIMSTGNRINSLKDII